MSRITSPRLLALLLLAYSLLSGCQLPYYWQAAKGQWQLNQNKQPISTLLADEATPAATKAALSYLLEAREFALQKLKLTTNQSYLDYVETKGDYITWNVFATKELSINNVTWCFPIAGCVSYRGYFDQTDAQDYARQLADQGYDTYVAGAGAYSTLGWFDDPVLSTFLQRDKLTLAALLFHELAHQVLYVRDDTEFNESFATSIEQILLQQWIEQQELENLWPEYQRALEMQEAFTRMILDNKEKRGLLFESDLSEAAMREAKTRLIEDLVQEYQSFRRHWKYEGYDDWINQGGLNNAQVSTVAAYHGFLPGLLQLYDQSNQDLDLYLNRCRELADLKQAQRHEKLK